MPLETPYGVNVGALHDTDLVKPDTGQWPHYHVRISPLGVPVTTRSVGCRHVLTWRSYQVIRP